MDAATEVKSVKFKTMPTWTATIWIGRRVGYTETVLEEHLVEAALKAYVNKVGLCVSVMPAEFIYTNGSEPGFAVGLIQYPRFPTAVEELEQKAQEIATRLMECLHQKRCTIVTPKKTIMLEMEE